MDLYPSNHGSSWAVAINHFTPSPQPSQGIKPYIEQERSKINCFNLDLLQWQLALLLLHSDLLSCQDWPPLSPTAFKEGTYCGLTPDITNFNLFQSYFQYHQSEHRMLHYPHYCCWHKTQPHTTCQPSNKWHNLGSYLLGAPLSCWNLHPWTRTVHPQSPWSSQRDRAEKCSQKSHKSPVGEAKITKKLPNYLSYLCRAQLIEQMDLVGFFNFPVFMYFVRRSLKTKNTIFKKLSMFISLFSCVYTHTIRLACNVYYFFCYSFHN